MAVGWTDPLRDAEAFEGEVVSLLLYQRVALRHDLPEHRLRKGDVAVLLDYVPNSHSYAAR
jgi:hypothetical protein